MAGALQVLGSNLTATPDHGTDDDAMHKRHLTKYNQKQPF